MKIPIILSLLGNFYCLDDPLDLKLDESWDDFKKMFSKSYDAEEESQRRIIWEEKIKDIVHHNIKTDLGLHSYRIGLNDYSDMGHEELLKRRTGYRTVHNISADIKKSWVPPSNISLPRKVDWRDKGLVTPVKDQRKCGSCWAFSTTGAVEGQLKKKTGKLVKLSEQNLVDCVVENSMCDGGWMDYAFQYIRNNKGINTELTYPYTAFNGSCNFNVSDNGTSIVGFVDLPEGSENALQLAVASVGPIAVAINVDNKGFLNYKSGVYDEPNCGKNNLNHAVLVVGYGNYNGKDYWLVKNSWGEAWGIKGYVMMARNKNNQCGIATKASFPLM